MEASQVTTIEMIVGNAMRDGELVLNAERDVHVRARALLREAIDRELVRVNPEDAAAGSLLDGTSYPGFNNALVTVRRGFWASLHNILAQQPVAPGAQPNHRVVSIAVTLIQQRLHGDGIDLPSAQIEQRLDASDPWFAQTWEVTGSNELFEFRRI
jgi:hypothetical protein